jgi:hypothetical protein
LTIIARMMSKIAGIRRSCKSSSKRFNAWSAEVDFGFVTVSCFTYALLEDDFFGIMNNE